MEIAVIEAGNVGRTLGMAWAQRGRRIVCGVHDLSGIRGIVGSVLKAWLLASRVAVVLFGEVRVFHRPPGRGDRSLKPG